MEEKQYVIFKLGNEHYGMDIMHVKEITENKETTKIPNSPDFIDGVINLRGRIVPVINLKKRFGLKNTEIKENSRIIIVTMGEKLVGFIIDDASQVMSIKDEEIESPPEIIASVDKKYIVGIGKTQEKMIILLDTASIFLKEEENQMKSMQDESFS